MKKMVLTAFAVTLSLAAFSQNQVQNQDANGQRQGQAKTEREAKMNAALAGVKADLSPNGKAYHEGPTGTGSAVSSRDGASRSSADKPDKPDKAGPADKPDKPERPDKVDKPDRRSDGPNMTGKL